MTLTWSRHLEAYKHGPYKGIMRDVWMRRDGWKVCEVSFSGPQKLWVTRAPDGHLDPRFKRRFSKASTAMAAVDKRAPLQD